MRIKLKHMEIEIRRKETTGAGTAAHSESETLAKYEIMDGAPVRGESVPIRCVTRGGGASVTAAHSCVGGSPRAGLRGAASTCVRVLIGSAPWCARVCVCS